MRNGYFHFEAVKPVDISKFVEVMLTLISVDLVSLVSSTIFLKLACNINLFKVTFILPNVSVLQSNTEIDFLRVFSAGLHFPAA